MNRYLSLGGRLLAGACLCLLLSTHAMAQNSQGKTPITQQDYQNQDIEMADAWRANGKIYVVVATVSTLLVGIFAYLIVLDRKIAKLEKE